MSGITTVCHTCWTSPSISDGSVLNQSILGAKLRLGTLFNSVGFQVADALSSLSMQSQFVNMKLISHALHQ